MDPDTLKWFRVSFPKGYQTKINEILIGFRKEQEIRKEVVLERAGQLFKKFHAQCFWHLNKELKMTPELLPMIQQGLRKNGGREGFELASTIQLEKPDAY